MMRKHKVTVNLEKVSKTLLLPLLGRAKCSKLAYSPLVDQKAIDLVESLDYDFSHLEKQVDKILLYWMARAWQFDKAVKNYVQTYPHATIVNLGAGLETAFYRVDNGSLTWVDLDLPQVMALRHQLIKSEDRVHSISASVLDFDWINKVKPLGDRFLFIASGLLMYLTEAQVKTILLTIANNFPGAEFVFNSIDKKRVKFANQMLKESNMLEAEMQWWLDDPSQLEKWSNQIQVVSAVPFFNGIKHYFPPLIAVKSFLYDLLNKGRIVHIRFAKEFEKAT